MTDLSRPVPHPTALSQPFWDGCADERLVAQRCAECRRYVFIPQAFCRYCHSTELDWVEVSGRGTVYSYTTVWRPQTPAFPVPYVVAIIDLDEGYQMMSNVVCPPEEVAIGMPVAVTFEQVNDMTLPVFRPADLVVTESAPT